MNYVTRRELRRKCFRSLLAMAAWITVTTGCDALYAQKPAPPAPPAAPQPPRMEKFRFADDSRGRASQRRIDDMYRRGVREIDDRDYEQAVEAFDRVIESKNARAEGALYWKAYSLNRLGRGADGLSAIAELEKAYPKSRWLNDARALQVEIRQASGQTPRPESQNDEDLKLLAINGLMHNDPEAAIPLLEKVLNTAKNPPRLKQRALFVLAQSRSPKAKETVLQYAKGGSNPDLQLTAVEFLGMSSTPEIRQTLSEIYSSSQDPSVRRAVMRAYMMAKDKDRLFQVVKAEQNVELRREGYSLLGNSGGHAELMQLYGNEQDKDARRGILDGLFVGNKPSLLIEVARKETDPELKREAVQRLSNMRSKEATQYLEELLGK